MADTDTAARREALDLLKLDVEEIEYRLRLRKATEEWEALRKSDAAAKRARRAAKQGETEEGDAGVEG